MKRILIVGADILNQQNATGITLRSIFEGVDPTMLLGITWGQKKDNMSTEALPVRMIRLPYQALSAGNVLDNAQMKQISRRIRKAEVRKLPAPEQGRNVSRIRRCIKNVRQWLALLPARSGVKIASEHWETIRAFAPQVIYTVGESVTALRLAYIISCKLDIPIVMHFMDNWKHSIEWASNPLLKNYQKMLTKWCNMCYTRTTECIAIGEKMAAVYEKETGIKHTVVMNSVDVQSYHCSPREKDGVVRFVYAGGLHLGRNSILLAIGKIIDRICEENGQCAQLSIYTGTENMTLFAEQFSGLKHTQMFAAIPHEEIKQVYMKSDVLVHVESDSIEGNEFFRYSVSTKIPEYLSTGRTMLFWGSKELYLYNWLNENALAYTASNADEGELLIRKLVHGADNPFAENAERYAAAHFDISVARERFFQTIENAHFPSSATD